MLSAKSDVRVDVFHTVTWPAAAAPGLRVNNLPPLREVIARHGLDARRSLGQHFLLDGNLTARIARAAGDLSGRQVIEIGPGPGGLTRALLDTEAATVTAIEVDPRAVAAMHELAEHSGGRLRVVAADAIKADVVALVPPPRVIVANLPVQHRDAAAGGLATAGERLRAPGADVPARGGGAHLRSSRNECLRQAFGRGTMDLPATLALRIPPAAFVPPPNVFSAVVVLTPHPVQPTPALFARMERLTAAAFGQRRKMLRGALRNVGGEALLREAGIASDRRAETLSIAEFDRLARVFPT